MMGNTESSPSQPTKTQSSSDPLRIVIVDADPLEPLPGEVRCGQRRADGVLLLLTIGKFHLQGGYDSSAEIWNIEFSEP